MKNQLIECVPNFSEGNNKIIIEQITDEIESVRGVKLLNVDSGKAANRTVVTFIGSPDEVIEAAFRAIKVAGELIDMRCQKGTHPRIGATDVCPLIPYSNISLAETIDYTHKLSKRVGEELGIPVYCYEYASFKEKRRNLAHCRAGEYEGLGEKLSGDDWKPDFGPAKLNDLVKKTGATIIGARDFLIAFNVNLNTDSKIIAKEIAGEICEKGKPLREEDSPEGKLLRDDKGNIVYNPGMFKCVKGLGWFIKEYGIAQASFNLTDIAVTSIHDVYEAACAIAKQKGVLVTGSELVGLIPEKAMLDAGKYFLAKYENLDLVSEKEIINVAIKYLGLEELATFDQNKRIIEYILEANGVV